MKKYIWILVTLTLLVGCSAEEEGKQAVPEQVTVEVNEAINVVK